MYLHNRFFDSIFEQVTSPVQIKEQLNPIVNSFAADLTQTDAIKGITFSSRIAWYSLINILKKLMTQELSAELYSRFLS